MKIKEIIYRIFHPKTINIHSKWSYPSCVLSNFAAHQFVIDGVECNSMEGFLQSLKFEDVEEQKKICLLTGIEAKLRGANKDWQSTQTLYWRGRAIYRLSDEYQYLLQRAYYCMYKDNKCEFEAAFKAIGKRNLVHDIGSNNQKETILTEQEFIILLDELRGKLPYREFVVTAPYLIKKK